MSNYPDDLRRGTHRHFYAPESVPTITEVVGRSWRRYMLPSLLHPVGLLASFVESIECELGVELQEQEWPAMVSGGVDGAVEYLQQRYLQQQGQGE